MFVLNRPIDPSANADIDDVLRTKSALRRLGFFRGPIDSTPTMEMIGAIQSLQSATGLHRDGIMKPEGPTERMIASLLTGKGEDQDGDSDNPGAAPPTVVSNVNAVATVNAAVGINVAAAVTVVAAAAISVSVMGHGRNSFGRQF